MLKTVLFCTTVPPCLNVQSEVHSDNEKRPSSTHTQCTVCMLTYKPLVFIFYSVFAYSFLIFSFPVLTVSLRSFVLLCPQVVEDCYDIIKEHSILSRFPSVSRVSSAPVCLSLSVSVWRGHSLSSLSLLLMICTPATCPLITTALYQPHFSTRSSPDLYSATVEVTCFRPPWCGDPENYSSCLFPADYLLFSLLHICLPACFSQPSPPLYYITLKLHLTSVSVPRTWSQWGLTYPKLQPGIVWEQNKM